MMGDRLTPRIVVTLVLASLAACGTPATQAPSPDHSAEIVALNAYFAADFSCARATSQDIDLKRLNVQAGQYVDKCINLEAFTDGSALYVNASGMKPVMASSVGLYWNDSDAARRLKLGPSFVVITGRLRDCARHNAMTAEAARLRAQHDAVPAEPAIIGACNAAATAIFISEAQVVPTAMD